MPTENNNGNGTNQNENPADNNEQNKGAEGSADKTYTNDEVNAIVKKNTDKATAKLLKDLGITDVEKAKGILAKASEEESKNNPDTKVEEENSALKEQLAQAQHSHELATLENVLLLSEIKSDKVEKAVRLIDLDKCRDEKGVFSKEKAKAEVEALLKDWPELKKSASGKGGGFTIGSDGKEESTDDATARIRNAMGL